MALHHGTPSSVTAVPTSTAANAHRDVATAAQGPLSASSPSPQHLFPLNAPYRAPPLTCDLVLQHAARDATQLFLVLLLPELRPFVDRLLATPRWHSASQITRLDSHFSGPAFWKSYAVASTGERLVAGSCPRDWTPGMQLGEEVTATVIRCDLPVGDPRRVVEQTGAFLDFVDLRPLEELHFLVKTFGCLSMYTLTGHRVARWASSDSKSVRYSHPWVRWDRQLCHVARRDRILRIPDSVSHPELANVWGAAGEERMCARDALGLESVRVQVFDLARGVVLYTLSEAGPRWCVNMSLGVVMHAPNGSGYHKGDPTRFPVKIYSLTTGPLLAVPLFWKDEWEEAVIFYPEGELELSTIVYWSPRDPHQLRSLDLGDWRLVAAHGGCVQFKRNEEYLLWRWGHSAAVRVVEAGSYFDSPLRVSVCNGAAFVTSFSMGAYSVTMIPLLSEPTADGLPPPALPHHNAPLVSARELYRGPNESLVLPPKCSETRAPLIVTQAHSMWLTLCDA